MTDYLLDTNHAGRLLRDDRTLWARLEAMEDSRVGLCRPSIGELWFMVFNSRRAKENADRLNVLCSHFVIWEFDEAASIEFGRIRVELRAAGRPIPMIDVQIAAIARRNGLVLLSSDHHFDEVEHLEVENWLESG